MRAAIYFHSLAGAGGAEKQAINLARYLASHGHAVHLISLDDPDGRSFHEIPGQVTWHRLGWDGRLRGRIHRVLRLRGLIRNYRIDVFIGFVMGGDKTIYAALVGLPSSLIAAERNDPIIYRHAFSPWKRWIYWLLFLICDRIVIQLDRYRSGYPWWLASRIECIGNPINWRAVADPASRHHENGTRTILSVGRLHPQKGHDLLIRAFASTGLATRGWRLRIVGSGPWMDTLIRQCAHYCVTEYVTFHAPTRNIRDEYQSTTIFALPSRYEGFPNALAEAMASGVPCVGFQQCQGVAGLIEHERTGLLADGSDDDECAAELAKALLRLADDPNLRDALGAQAAVWIRQYGGTDTFQQWEHLLTSLS